MIWHLPFEQSRDGGDQICCPPWWLQWFNQCGF